MAPVQKARRQKRTSQRHALATLSSASGSCQRWAIAEASREGRGGLADSYHGCSHERSLGHHFLARHQGTTLMQEAQLLENKQRTFEADDIESLVVCVGGPEAGGASLVGIGQDGEDSVRRHLAVLPVLVADSDSVHTGPPGVALVVVGPEELPRDVLGDAPRLHDASHAVEGSCLCHLSKQRSWQPAPDELACLRIIEVPCPSVDATCHAWVHRMEPMLFRRAHHGIALFR